MEGPMPVIIRIAAFLFVFGICLENASAQGFMNNDALMNALRNRSATPAAVNPGTSQPPVSAAQVAPQTQNLQQPKARWNQQTQNALPAPTVAAANVLPNTGPVSGAGNTDPNRLRDVFHSLGR